MGLILTKQRELCKNENEHNSISCNIDENKKIKIIKFLSETLPKCNNLNIHKGHVINGQLVGKGYYGYTFIVSKYAIKILIVSCPNIYNEQMYDYQKDQIFREFEIHTHINNSKNINFIIAYDFYYPHTSETTYMYKDMILNKEVHCANISILQKFSIFPKPKPKPKINCDDYYLIMEKGDNIFDIIKKDINEIIRMFYILIPNFYSINEYFITKTGTFFTHNDIKLENMVLVKNNIKIIDFGQADMQTEFNIKNLKSSLGLIQFLFNCKPPCQQKIASPLFDIFMLIIVLLIILNIKQNVYTYEKIKDDKEIGYLKLKEILEHIKEKNFLQQIINLGDFIYNFYNDTYTNTYKSNLYLISLNNFELFKATINKLDISLDIKDNFPNYNGEKSLLNDYTYIYNVIKYILKYP